MAKHTDNMVSKYFYIFSLNDDFLNLTTVYKMLKKLLTIGDSTLSINLYSFQTINNIARICEAEISMPQASLSWLLQQDTVKSVIVGASSPEQVEKNITLQQASYNDFYITNSLKVAAKHQRICLYTNSGLF